MQQPINAQHAHRQIDTLKKQQADWGEQFAVILNGDKKRGMSFAAQALELLTQAPKVAEAIRSSDLAKTQFISSMALCAISGLSPSPQLGQVYIVPFKTKDGPSITLIISARGYQKIARDNDIIIFASKVYPGEDFSIDHGSMEVHHKTNPFAGQKKKTEDGKKLLPSGFYAIARDARTDRNIGLVTMTRADIIEYALKYSKAKKIQRNDGRTWFAEDSAWTTEFEKMAIKTVIKQVAKNVGFDFAAALYKNDVPPDVKENINLDEDEAAEDDAIMSAAKDSLNAEESISIDMPLPDPAETSPANDNTDGADFF